MKKINIGAGSKWFEPGWEVLDNGTGDYSPAWKHKGKAWDNDLPSRTYDIVFTSHMLEHIPHFRLEKTFAEFNRIMKVGGTLRILVPNLKKYATAYVNGDVEYFSGSRHYSNHLGIGGSFVRLLISPGQQTVAMSRELDEIFGGYAHLYAFDFEMMQKTLTKWGFGEIIESEPGQSAVAELRTHQHLMFDGEKIENSSDFVRNGEYKKSDKTWNFGGFDKTSETQLAVEAIKFRDEPYSYDKEWEFNKQARFGGGLDNVKLSIFRTVCLGVDGAYFAAKRSGLLRVLNAIRR